MELQLVGSKVLKRKAKRVDKIDDKIRNVAAAMIEVMTSNHGIGISGNQVGIEKRIIVVMINDQPKVMVNPEIIFISDNKCKENEGCLSFPNEFHVIERAESVTVKYRNLSGHPMLETHSGITARCILHEIDHLDGILFVDHLDSQINTVS